MARGGVNQSRQRITSGFDRKSANAIYRNVYFMQFLPKPRYLQEQKEIHSFFHSIPRNRWSKHRETQK